MIPPGSTIGMLGGGQLGRMSMLAGRHMGYRFHLFEPSTGNCAGCVADMQYNAPYDDEAALAAFANEVDIITLEFENIPKSALDILEWRVPVRPGSTVLETCQHRAHEKQFLSDNGFPCAPYEVIHSMDELASAIKSVGTPSVLKTATMGYDGKGQYKLESQSDGLVAWEAVGGVSVLEKWIQFDGEYSVIVARNKSGDVKSYPVFENRHRNHILDITIAPARISEKQAGEARSIAEAIAEKLNVIGLITVEFFLDKQGNWIVNELAPRPHNSGHLTIDACATSQFEQHIRAVCDLPLGSTELLTPATMLNLLGDVWHNTDPDWKKVFVHPLAKLHLYDKGEPAKGRKMGHATFLADDVEDALIEALSIRTLYVPDAI